MGGAGLRYVFEQGTERIRIHEQSLLDQLLQGLSQIPGIMLYQPQDMRRRAPIVSFNLPGWEPAEAGAILDQALDIKVRTGLHCAAATHKTFGTYPDGSIRISLGHFNTAQDVESVLQALGKIASSKP